MKISLKIQSDNSFPRIIHRKIHFRYIGVNILGSLSPSKNCFLSTWRRDVTASLNFIRYNYIVVVNTLQSNIVKALVTGSTSLSTRGNCNNSIKLSLSVPLSPTNERPKAWLVHVCMDAYCFSVYTLLSLSLSLSFCFSLLGGIVFRKLTFPTTERREHRASDCIQAHETPLLLGEYWLGFSLLLHLRSLTPVTPRLSVLQVHSPFLIYLTNVYPTLCALCCEKSI